jgi:hypothetical protein
MRQFSLFIVLNWIAFYGASQQQHLEIGAKLGFKDEFHAKPSFDLNARYTEIHYFDAYFFGRVSKRRFGNEFGIGFEKASDYFVRYDDNSKQFGYINLNRIQIDISQYYYFIKTPLHKWDVQLGLRNYIGFNNRIWIPQGMDLKAWKLSGRITTNYTYKTFILGMFYEYDFRSDYVQFDRAAVFGFNFGVIY